MRPSRQSHSAPHQSPGRGKGLPSVAQDQGAVWQQFKEGGLGEVLQTGFPQILRIPLLPLLSPQSQLIHFDGRRGFPGQGALQPPPHSKQSQRVTSFHSLPSSFLVQKVPWRQNSSRQERETPESCPPAVTIHNPPHLKDLFFA